jgi:hypothetical protein
MLPKFIGLCGYPTTGKTEVQKILTRRFGVIPIDDGLPLRRFAADNLDIEPQDPFTQEGKKKIITIIDEEMEVRQFLGELGNALEAKFGEYILPFLAVNSAPVLTAPAGEVFSFGSVRKYQGHFYKQQGGIIVEVRRKGVVWSGNAFDLYDRDAVDIVIQNDGTLEDLEAIVWTIFDEIRRASWVEYRDRHTPKVAA